MFNLLLDILVQTPLVCLRGKQIEGCHQEAPGQLVRTLDDFSSLYLLSFLRFCFKSSLHPAWGSHSQPRDQESHTLLSQPGTPVPLYFSQFSFFRVMSHGCDIHHPCLVPLILLKKGLASFLGSSQEYEYTHMNTLRGKLHLRPSEEQFWSAIYSFLIKCLALPVPFCYSNFFFPVNIGKSPTSHLHHIPFGFFSNWLLALNYKEGRGYLLISENI